jgi:hypothetical protein
MPTCQISREDCERARGLALDRTELDCLARTGEARRGGVDGSGDGRLGKAIELLRLPRDSPPSSNRASSRASSISTTSTNPPVRASICRCTVRPTDSVCTSTICVRRFSRCCDNIDCFARFSSEFELSTDDASIELVVCRARKARAWP